MNGRELAAAIAAADAAFEDACRASEKYLKVAGYLKPAARAAAELAWARYKQLLSVCPD